MVYCDKCGEENINEAKFCQNCGETLKIPESTSNIKTNKELNKNFIIHLNIDYLILQSIVGLVLLGIGLFLSGLIGILFKAFGLGMFIAVAITLLGYRIKKVTINGNNLILTKRNREIPINNLKLTISPKDIIISGKGNGKNIKEKIFKSTLKDRWEEFISDLNILKEKL